MSAKGGVTGIILLGGILYFTHAGTWMWEKVKTLDDRCYAAFSGRGGVIGERVCGVVTAGISGIGTLSDTVGDALIHWKQEMLGNSDSEAIDAFASDMRSKFTSLASARTALEDMIRTGPRGFSVTASPAQQLQQAIDSFSIGQIYLHNENNPAQALPWLQHGAAQPRGFGLMSQLTLGNLYLQGGQGVAANPQMAQAYLQQARDSLAMLSATNSPQNQQLLQTLPTSPQALQQQLERVLREMNKR